jgi:hypothetical protein
MLTHFFLSCHFRVKEQKYRLSYLYIITLGDLYYLYIMKVLMLLFINNKSCKTIIYIQVGFLE